MVRYLLPCVCGRRIPVSTSQAGEQLRCECGQTIEVPTLRHLTALERIADAPPRRERTWGTRQGLVFLGVSLLVIASGWLVYLQVHKPPTITEPLVKSNTNAMTPAQLWTFWDRLERGIQRQLFTGEAAMLQRSQFDLDTWAQWRLTALAAGGVGVLIVAIGLFLIPSASQRRTR